MKISRSQLIQVLKNSKAQPVGLTTDTDARLPKKSGFAGTRKLSNVNGFIGVNYENCVNNKLEKEGFEREFQAGERVWGEHSEGLIEKDGKFYLQIKVEHVKSEYIKDGKKIPLSELSNVLKTKEEFIKVRSYSLDSIKEVRMNGQIYQIGDNYE